jgi:hypothetical protein
MTKARGTDFFSPDIMHAEFAGERVAKLTEREVLANGGELFARIEYTLDATAQLAALQRMVKDSALGKVFADGQVFDQIEDTRVADVSFYKMANGTGVQIAKLQGGINAITAVLSKADMADMDLAPKYSPEKQIEAPAEAPKLAKLQIGEGNTIEVQLKAPKESRKEEAKRSPFPMEAAAAPMQAPMHNPVAAKAFLFKALTSESQAAPSNNVEQMLFMSFMATSSHIHPEDKAWPRGITVVNKMGAEDTPIASPAQAVAVYKAALRGDTAPVVDREDLVAQMAQRRAAKM